MKHCPNHDCPFLKKTKRASEYLDSARLCSDCGGELIDGQSPERAPEQHSVGTVPPYLVRRAAVTLGALAVMALAWHIPIPFASSDSDSLIRELPTRMHGPAGVSLLAIGLSPYLYACILVEIACLSRGEWRKLRTGNPRGRASLARTSGILCLVLAFLQAFGIAMYAQGLFGNVSGGWRWAEVLLIMAAPMAGTYLLLGLAQAVNRWGLGHGIAVLFLGTTVLSAAQAVARTNWGEYESSWLRVAATVLVVVAVTVAAIRSSDRGKTSPIRLPASGVVPVHTAATLLYLPTALGLAVMIQSRVFAQGTAARMAVECAIAMLLAGLFAWLFHQPRFVAALLLRRGLNEGGATAAMREARAQLGKSLPRTLLVIGALAIAGSLLSGHALGALVGVEALVVLTAFVMDLSEEWRARYQSDNWVDIWPEHRMYAVELALAELRRAGVAVFARGMRVRSMLQFFGPFIPVDLFVPEPQAKQATQILSRLLGPGESGDVDAIAEQRNAGPWLDGPYRPPLRGD
jgi:preprotein translocase subunit SecY